MAVGKTELINRVSEKVGMPKNQVDRILEGVLGEVRSSLDNGESVTLRGFGSFKVHERAARKGRNPRTGEEIDIPAGRNVGFTFSR